jgi:DNA recombination protein RmuC
MQYTTAFICIFASCFGVALGWLVGSRANGRSAAASEVELRTRDEALEQLRRDVAGLRDQFEKECRDHGNTRALLAGIQARAESEQTSAEGKLAALLEVENRLKDAFPSLAASALAANSRHLLDLNKGELGKQQLATTKELGAKESSIAMLLKPMQESLEQLARHTQSLEVKREGAYEAILSEVQNIQRSHTDLRRETTQLVQALRAPKVRGNWGEMQLRRCVEHAGMVEFASFDVEKFVRGEDVSIRPDLIVRLPNNRCIVVDAKTPLDAFLNSAACEDETLRHNFLIEHASAVRKHLDALSAKAYWNRFVESPDFVVCFLPSEVLFSAALEQDPSLLEYSASTKVLLATPTTLIALLKAVAYGWQQAQIARDAEVIRDVSNRLYAKLAGMHKSFVDMGNALKRAGDVYDDVLNKAEGHGGLFSIARKLRELKIGDKDLSDAAPISIRPRILQHEDWQPGLAMAASSDDEAQPESNSVS